jgi:hypothetical protein
MKSKYNINNQILINNLQYISKLCIKYIYARSDKRIVRSKQIDLPTIYSSEITIEILGR